MAWHKMMTFSEPILDLNNAKDLIDTQIEASDAVYHWLNTQRESSCPQKDLQQGLSSIIAHKWMKRHLREV